MVASRKKVASSSSATLKVFVLESAGDTALKEATLCNSLEDPWVSWSKQPKTECFMQCTIKGNSIDNTDDVNVWQIAQFDPVNTPLEQVADLQMCPDFTLYPVIFQPHTQGCTAAKIGKIIKAVCKSTSSTGLAEASTVASVAIAMSSASVASLSVGSMSIGKKTKKKHNNDDTDDSDSNDEINDDDDGDETEDSNNEDDIDDEEDEGDYYYNHSTKHEDDGNNEEDYEDDDEEEDEEEKEEEEEEEEEEDEEEEREEEENNRLANYHKSKPKRQRRR